ncbi:hypothetical protein L2E82_11680 [Cichorium intybus]|uniref:Uncharacterized protein n=1 Tax=Cichorium intybus TaxID=13427 RepID=A0ACB9GF16_CICIN|nr:hypothetical protein L2E82_11680 [Cichorium intybus]
MIFVFNILIFLHRISYLWGGIIVENSRFDLEEIIGLTVKNGNGLASSISDSKFVYIAGCVVVLYDVDSWTQSHLMVSNRSPKPLSCVAVSQDGSYIAAASRRAGHFMGLTSNSLIAISVTSIYCLFLVCLMLHHSQSGQQPSIIVWSSATLTSISELKGHQYGVACMAFSPDGKHLVSIGIPQDGYLCLWDYRSGTLVKKLKACSSFSAVASVSFSADANFILTAGKRHLKIWTVGLPTKSRAKTEKVSPTMHGKTVNLGLHKGCTFIAVTSSIKSGEPVLIYALTDSGVLCLLHGGLTITHSVDLKVEKGYGLSASQEFIACACDNGVVKLYTIGSLEHAGDLHYSEHKQNKKTTDTLCQSKSQEGIQQNPNFPDAIACQFSTSQKLVSHSGCIWDIKNLSCENMHDPSLSCVARGCTGGVSFATCSVDGSIRLWDLALQSLSTDQQHLPINEPLPTSCLVSAGTFERESVVSGVFTQGYRSMAVSSDGNHLAAGDSDGNLHIFNLETSDYTCIQDVHEGEILSLNFSLPIDKRNNSNEDLESYYFLASGGSDKMIHLFDVDRNFDLIASVGDHLSAVTSVQFTGNGRKLISCSSDRALISRDIAGNGKDYNISHSHQQKASQGTVFDIAIDPITETAVTDKKINMFDIPNGKVIKSFKDGEDYGDPIKIVLDPSCSYVVCSYSDRSICMYDMTSGVMVARAVGHSDVINAIIFLPDCKHLVSVGSDSCIFVWKVPTLMTSKMSQKINGNYSPLSPSATAVNQIKFHKENHLRSQATTRAAFLKCPQDTSAFRFSVSRLPHWAKSKVTSPLVIPMDPISSEHSPSKSSSVDADVDLSLHLHTPSNHNIDSQKRLPTSNSKNCRSFALDKRWVTIHNVCLDVLNSPEVYNSRFSVRWEGSGRGRSSSQRGMISLNIKEEKDCDIERSEKQNMFDACKEALRTLEASSKTTLELFSKLRTHENLEGQEGNFYGEVAEMLPLIAKNVHEIVKITSSCGGDKVEIPGFEPLLGKFAESLSQRVIELLKENCTNL